MECPLPYKLSDFTAHSSLPLQDRDALEELITGWTSPIPSRTSWAGLVITAGACLSSRGVLGIWVWTASNRWPGRWLGSRTFMFLMKALTKNADGQGFFTSCGVSNSVISGQWRLHISNAHLRHLGSAHLQLRRNLTIFRLKVLKLVMKRWTGARPEVSTRNARIARRVVAWYPLFHELKKRALWAQEHGHPQHWFTEQTFLYSGRLKWTRCTSKSTEIRTPTRSKLVTSRHAANTQVHNYSSLQHSWASHILSKSTFLLDDMQSSAQ